MAPGSSLCISTEKEEGVISAGKYFCTNDCAVVDVAQPAGPFPDQTNSNMACPVCNKRMVAEKELKTMMQRMSDAANPAASPVTNQQNF
jgi:hypothetical protein